jgi:hypothetical protein
MKALLSLVPSWVPFAAIGLVLALLKGGYFMWQAHQRSIGASGVVQADQKGHHQDSEKDRRC